MKEDVLDVLLYVFENYQETGLPHHDNPDILKTELEAAGFQRQQVDHACTWLEGLAAQQREPGPQLSASAMRAFAPVELAWLSTECRGFVLHLEQLGILTPELRETVLDRLMALAEHHPAEEIDLEQTKWVVLMVLFNQPGQEAAYAWVEDLVYNQHGGLLH
jgi:Smg protein